MAEPTLNGLGEVPEIKSEPLDDPLLDPNEPPVIPKEFTIANGIHEDSDCEDIAYFTQVEVDNTRKCLENTRLIIKDFETQLDWHLQQYMTLRNVFSNKKGGKGKDEKRQDLLSISQLSAIIANHPEGNKKFIKRKGPVSNMGGRKRQRAKDSESEEEETDFSDDSEEYDEDFDEDDSEDIDDPAEAKKKKGRGKKKNDHPQVKDEIEEEFHDLIEPKEEIESDEEMEMMKKTPAKRGRKANETKTTPAKKGGRGKKGKNMETVDLTNMKSCSVVLNRLEEDDDSNDADIKDEELDRDELIEMLQDQAVDAIENFHIDAEKPIVILKEDNHKEFDFNECSTGNVVITFEDRESFPEFIFIKNIADHILDGSIMLVQTTVFDEHLNSDKN